LEFDMKADAKHDGQPQQQHRLPCHSISPKTQKDDAVSVGSMLL
jgi:hypothetical protein